MAGSFATSSETAVDIQLGQPETGPSCPLIDRIVAAMGLLLLSPIMLVVAALIKLESPGPVFFRQLRVGKNGRLFWLYKFRKMPHGLDKGPKISPKNDLRLTRIGRFMERMKLDELPQLFNVLRGEMRIIGPRPEVPEIVELYTPRQRLVLNAWPGITGPNQIIWRNEKDLIPHDVDDVEDYYVRFILPQKIETDLKYLQSRTFWTDLRLLLQTAWVTCFEPLRPKHLYAKLNFVAHLASDAVLVTAATAFAVAFVLTPGVSPGWRDLASSAAVLAGLHYVGFLVSGVSRQAWKLVGKKDLVVLSVSLFGSTLAGAPVVLLSMPAWWALRLLAMCYVTTLLAVGGGRFGVAITEEYRHSRSRKTTKRANAVIYGVNRESELFLRRIELEQEPGLQVIGFLDHDPRKRGMRVRNVKVLGSAADLRLLHELKRVDVVYACVQKSDKGFSQLQRICGELGIALRTVHSSDVGSSITTEVQRPTRTGEREKVE